MHPLALVLEAKLMISRILRTLYLAKNPQSDKQLVEMYDLMYPMLPLCTKWVWLQLESNVLVAHV